MGISVIIAPRDTYKAYLLECDGIMSLAWIGILGNPSIPFLEVNGLLRDCF